tara:strand:+ start:96 stop:335 length:240 start_codon:yes stop_codon:yes gene_type:complete
MTTTLTPNQVGTATPTGHEWFGVGQWETLDVTLCSDSGLTVEEMDGETRVATYTGGSAVDVLKAEGVTSLLAGSDLLCL